MATLGAVYVVLAFGRRLAVHRLGTMAARSATRVDDLGVDLISRTRQYFLFAIALFAATRLLVLPENARGAIQLLMVAVVLLQAGRWGTGLIGFSVDSYLRRNTEGDAGARATVQAVGYAARFALWSILLITALAAFGIDVTALITGLGIGGIAIALAVQNILGDLFAALAIVLDKPFVVGDSITVDTVNGTVEHVGLKTTRIRSVSGEQIIIANGELLKSRIRNYKRMEQRRVVFNVDLAYDTPPAQLERVPGIIRSLVERQPLVRFERSHLLTLTDSALRFENVYWVMDADYHRYADIQHAINIDLLRQLGTEHITFAHPVRPIFLKDTQNPAIQ